MEMLLFFTVLIFSIVIHEFSHAWMANYLGDPTAKYAGRLTLNPLAHLDLFGSLIIPLLLYFTAGFVFGWAKPVPFNPYNLRDQKYGPALVGFAGPGANISVAVVFGLLFRSGIFNAFLEIFTIIIVLNLILAIFNLIPIPPLDGSKILFAFWPYQWEEARIFLERFGFIILLFFIFFAFRFILPIVFWLFKLITGYPLVL